MNEPLFRPQALAARRHGWLGAISLSQPVQTRVQCGIAMLAAAAILAFLACGEYTQRARVAGQLVPDLGLATVVAPLAGVVTAPMPDEGAAVTAGEALVVISTARATSGSGDTSAGLLEEIERRRAGMLQGAVSRQELLDLQESGLNAQLEAARLELGQVESAIESQRRRAGLAANALQDYRALAAQTFVSRIQVSRQEQAALAEETALQSLERETTALRRTIALIRQSLAELPLQRSVQAATKLAELATLEQERLQVESRREVLVAAPLDGLIASRLIERGQSVLAGESLLSVLPAGSRLEAHLLVPGRAIGFIDPGDPVVLRYEAFPHQKFGHQRGTVARISRHALAAGGEPLYRVIVELSGQTMLAYGETEALLPGMRVEADILGETRKLYEWLLEPLYSLSGKL